MSVSINHAYPENLQSQPTLAHDNIMPEDDEHSLTMSESYLSEYDNDGEHVRRKVASGEEHDHGSKCSNKSMSVFMTSLVGLHSGDWSFCLQVDNAKPRDLPPPQNSSIAEPGPDSSSITSNNRKSNGLSRWESTPRNQCNHKNNKSGSTTASVAQITRTRAMRPWKHPSNSAQSNASLSSINSSSRKLDAPVSRPQRYDSNRSLKSNAKLPQRAESNRSLKPELSIRDLAKSSADNITHNHAHNLSGRHECSMDLRVFFECEEDNMDDAAANFGPDCDEDESGGVFLKIPVMQSQSSLWSSASTMTASFRTMASASLMSHYSISHHSNYNASSSLESSKRSLFCKSEEERPLCPPRRTKSREGVHMGFRSSASEMPVRRPVRSPSDRSMLNAVAVPEASAASAEAAVVTSDCLLPALIWQDSSLTFSFKLIRSLSEQTLETAALFQNRHGDTNDSNNNSIPKDGVRRFLKRTLSDSLLFMSQELNVSEHLQPAV